MDWLILILIMLYMAHTMPAISVFYPSSIYAAVTVMMVVFISTRISWNSFRKIIPLMLFPVMNLFFVDGVFVNYAWWASLLQLFAFPLIALYLLQNNNKKTAKLIFWTYVAFQIIISITTNIGLNRYPEACRLFGNGDFSQTTEFVLFRSLNIGGWGFIYSMVLSLPLIVLVWRHSKDFKGLPARMTLFALLFLLLSLVTIYRSQYTTALLFSVLAVALSLINKELKTSTIVMVAVIGVILFMALRQPLISFMNYLSSETSGEILQERFESMSQSLQGEGVDDNSDLAARQYFWEASLKTFFSYPLGSWSNSTIGGHSTWLDSLARYGLFTIIFIVLTIRGMKKYILQHIRKTRLYNHVLVSFIILLIMGLFNPSYNTDFMLFLVPLFLYVIADINLLKPQSIS